MKLGIYRHSKSGKEYRVLGIAKHSETVEDMVLYEPLYENSITKYWVRPIKMFEEIVEVKGEKVPRFQFISDN